MPILNQIFDLIEAGIEVPGEAVKWMSTDDPRCDLCQQPAVVDMRTKYGGGWGLLCPSHVLSRGCGMLGLGFGQAILNTKATRSQS